MPVVTHSVWPPSPPTFSRSPAAPSNDQHTACMAHSEHSPTTPFDPTATIHLPSPSPEDTTFFSKLLSRHPSTSSASSTANPRRRSFNILTTIPDHFSTLVRSHSSSVRKSTCTQPPPITSRAFFSGYADKSTFVQEIPVRSASLDMPLSRPAQEEERPSRKQKSENRFYNFLTRSRSRSVSKKEDSSTEVEPTTRPMPDLPQNPRSPPGSLGRRSNIPIPTQSGSKPASRLQSRPLSSTTTATNTTITPATPKVKKRPSTAIPSTTSPLVASSSKPLESRSRPTTPKPSGARRKLHDLFAIPLSRLSSSRSRSRSRPSTPHASPDVPPLPATPGTDDDPTPRPRRSSPHSIRGAPPPRSPSPTPERRVLRVTNATPNNESSTGSTAASVKITKFFSKGGSSASEQKKLGHQHSASGPPVLPPIPAFVSAPLKRVSSLHRRSVKDPIPDQPQLVLPSSLPKIIHTPPTPAKNGNGTAESSKLPAPTRPGHHHAMKGSLDSGIRYRPPMAVLDEESRADFSHKDKGRAVDKARENEAQAVPRPQPIKMSNSARSTKHGSFDFERPGWGAAMMQRTGSNGTTATQNTAASGWNQETAKERESKYGPGLAGVGTLQRDMSMKRAQEREEFLKREHEKARKWAVPSGVDSRQKEKERKSHEKEKTAAAAAAAAQQQHSQQTTPSGSTSTAGTGKISSMSKATGKRLGHAHKRASGSGISRLVGIAHHGLFSFEPPVPSPTLSTGSTGTAHDGVVLVPSADRKDRERERLQAEKERQRDLRRGGRAGDRAPVPVPLPPGAPGPGPAAFPTQTNAGHRSGAKGRSLDLGLGLAWAPSKMKEEALLPSSTFFVRSLSGRSTSGSTTGRSATGGSSSGHGTGSGSRNASGRSRTGDEHDVERSRLGREVAEVFKNALGVEEYKLFKSYVHQFDAHEIPFDGPTGIVTLVDRLLVTAPHLGEEGKKRLLDNFVKIILQQA
ncbi:unnamed protein product [Cyclocybe aegerita]|uniref:Uncharacterized protein n=1 Tax=Cyclocybe aegerita TaxID=1973307 RepID=A0A8S0WDA0_CYCAE|nr:unnamed protein product [Cyclocybe aegerita]